MFSGCGVPERGPLAEHPAAAAWQPDNWDGGSGLMPKAAAEFAAVMLEEPRLEAPADLSEEERAEWDRIVARFPPHWFDHANGVLLRELCHHATLAKKLSEELANARRWKLTTNSPEGARRRQIFRQLLRMAQAETHAIVSLSTKLRLTNSSHRLPDANRGRGDERRFNTVPQGKPPWEQ
jgi:hypothetical protein